MYAFRITCWALIFIFNWTLVDNEGYLDGYEIIRKDCYTNGRNGRGVCMYAVCTFVCTP